jgi:hypothetical protein
MVLGRGLDAPDSKQGLGVSGMPRTRLSIRPTRKLGYGCDELIRSGRPFQLNSTGVSDTHLRDLKIG